MASYNQKLYAVQSAMVNKASPSANWHGAASFSFDFSQNSGEPYCLFSFESIPAAMRKKQFDGAEICVYFSCPTDNPSIFMAPLEKPFKQEDVTFLTAGTLYTVHGRWYDYYSDAYTGYTHIEANDLSDITSLIEKGLNVNFGPYGRSGYNSYTVCSHLSAYVPYLNLFFSDYKIQITESEATPSAGFVDEKKDSTFSWSIPQTHSADPIGQSSAKFRWRPAGSDTCTEIAVNGSQQSVTIPAGTFTTDSIEWQVLVTSDDGIEGEPSPWFSLTTVDSLSTPETVSPRDVMVDGAEPVRFRWNHVIETGSPQSGYELQYSGDDGVSWAALSSGDTSDTWVDIPPDTLPAGQLMWRVRTCNTDGAAGSWSEPACITVRSAPPVPSITFTGSNARPVIRWQSVGQQGYELMILDSGGTSVYRTGILSGTARQHRVRDYLPGGSYTVRLQVWNVYGLASRPASAVLQVSQTPIDPPQLDARTVPGGVSLRVYRPQDTAALYILRDGIPIKKLLPEESGWTDYAALGEHTYLARAIDPDDNFADSEPVTAVSSVRYATLAPADDPEDMLQLICRRDGAPTLDTVLTPMGQSSFYAGRTLPIYEFSEHSGETLNWSYSFRSGDEMERLCDLVRRRKTVRYRDHMGEACWCVLTGINISRDHISRDFTLSAVRVDYVERIDYDMEES